MKLSGIKQEHVLEAVAFIDHEGIPKKYLYSNYWVQVGGKEYPFNYLLRIAYQAVPGQEGQWQDVKSNPSMRAYMEQLGFEVRYRKEELGFFHESEVLLFSELADKPYRKANKEHVRFGEHLKLLAMKVNKWVELSLIEDLKYERSMKWQRYGHFKPYMWIRVRRPGSSPQVYFVIGCEGNGYLYAELNCQREDSKKAAKLTTEKISAFDAYLSKSHYHPFRIGANEIVNYDWTSLVEKTQEFIARHLALYDEMIALIAGKDLPQEKIDTSTPVITSDNRIARICWNTNGWVLPSGPKGKSSDMNCHEAKYGYGHEEWLFDLDKVIDGYHYGFLEPVRKRQTTYQGKSFNVLLFTVDRDSGRKYLVGEIAGLEVLNAQQGKAAELQYRNKGWHKEMTEQLDAEVQTGHGFSKFKGVDVFNVRFKESKCQVYPDLIPLENTDIVIKGYRYSFLMDDRSFDQKKVALNEPFVFTPNGGSVNEKLGRKKYSRLAKQVELQHTHKDISVEMKRYLVREFGENCVASENRTGKGTHIDMVTKVADKTTFYEIKTYTSLRYSLRVAIGQLLEYSMWANEYNANELVVVSHLEADALTVKYMGHLRKTLNLPIYYQQFDLDTNQLKAPV